VVDGFPTYAWQSCNDWIADYQTNNKALQATHGNLEFGQPIHEELNAGRAYVAATVGARSIGLQKKEHFNP
jgi:hypothetical protein